MLFRVDGGNIQSVAMGHVYRCIKLAVAARAMDGTEPRFIMRDYAGGVDKVREYGFETILLPKACSIDEDIELVSRVASGQTLFTDVRAYESEDVLKLREKAECLVLFDDLGRRDLQPHILVNPSVIPAHRQYPVNHDGVKYCLGLDYFLLGEHVGSPRVDTAPVVQRILVSLGGADPANYSAVLLKIIKPLAETIAFTFVLGPSYGRKQEIRALRESLGLDNYVVLLQDVFDLASLMTEFDMVISAGGDTCIEMAWSGVPGMIAPTISYEGETADYMEQQGVAVNLGDIKTCDPEVVVKSITALANDFERRVSLSTKGRQLVDGKGEQRILKLLKEI